MKVNRLMLILGISLLGCHKDKPITIDAALSACPANSDCSYSYYDQADFSSISPIGHGSNRVFSYWRSTGVCGPSSQFYIKTPLNSRDFAISLNQLPPGQLIAYNNSCPCCARATVIIPVIGGEIKRKRVSTNTWLLNARIIFGTSASHPTDSIKVNQYFTLAKLP